VNIHEIDTPALLVDLGSMERNLHQMARFFSAGPTKLRPHYKNHKCPALARKQIESGAIGMTCATLAEAEALVASGINGILISSEIAGDRKIRRFVELARQAEVIAAVDSARNVKAIAAAGRDKGRRIGVVVDVDVGLKRTGVKPGEPALDLTRTVLSEGLSFRGLMGYEGHVLRQPPGPEKDAAYDLAMSALIECRCLVERHDIPVGIVSAGGTGTYSLSRRFSGVTEIQAGSYLMMDTDYQKTCPDFELALSVLATVISRTGDERLIVDAGLKSISSERGMPTIKSQPGLHLRKLNAEHGIVDILDSSVSLQPGDPIEIWAHYSDATINLHERMYGVRNGLIEEILKVQG
jgi:D-serine deaminase-like pyridoxal phosphate-dependent protein